MGRDNIKFVNKIFLLLFVFNFCNAIVEQVDDSDLVHLLTGEENVITLFTKTNCPECDEWEVVVDNASKELKDSLNAVIVKAQNSQLVGIYQPNPTKEPALVYFRRGIPLLYYGRRNEEEIIQTFAENRDPVVKELSDVNFEHLTQASTGATTGDWFLFFYSADCVICQRLYAVWEAVGAKLKHRLTVARINRLGEGISTAKRFGIRGSPEFIFLRQGKFYRYRSKENTPKAFIEFADGGYQKQAHPEDVPELPAFMNDFFVQQLKSLLISSDAMLWGIVILSFLLTALFVVKCVFNRRAKPVTETRKVK